MQGEGKTTKFRELIPWIIALVALFAIPALIVRIAMDDVPRRSEVKVLTNFQNAVDVVSETFERHANATRQLSALPNDSVQWIVRINPNGRKAPGGGGAVLLIASSETGAIGLQGDATKVTITLPAYRTLDTQSVTIEKPLAANKPLAGYIIND